MLSNSFDLSKMNEKEFADKVKEFLSFEDAVKSYAYRILRDAGKIERNAVIEEVIFHCALGELVVIKVYQNTCCRIYRMSFSEFMR